MADPRRLTLPAFIWSVFALATHAAAPDDTSSPALVLLGVPGSSSRYRTLLVSSDPANPFRSIPMLVVPTDGPFVRVDMNDEGQISVVPLGRTPHFKMDQEAGADTSCYHSSGLLYVGPKYVSAQWSYECRSPGERTASGQSVGTFSLRGLREQVDDASVSISEAFGPSAPGALEAAARTRLNEECVHGRSGTWTSERNWAISRVSAAQEDTLDAERNRWRVTAYPCDGCTVASCYGSPVFEVPTLPDRGPLAVRIPPPDVADVTRAARTLHDERVIDIVAATPGGPVAVITEQHIILLRRTRNLWSPVRTLVWKREYSSSDVVVLAEWALGSHARRWWDLLSPYSQ